MGLLSPGPFDAQYWKTLSRIRPKTVVFGCSVDHKSKKCLNEGRTCGDGGGLCHKHLRNVQLKCTLKPPPLHITRYIFGFLAAA